MVCGATQVRPRSASSRSWIAPARRRTFRPPGSMPLAASARGRCCRSSPPRCRARPASSARGVAAGELVRALHRRRSSRPEASRHRQHLGGGARTGRAPRGRRRRLAGGRARARSARSRRRPSSRSPARCRLPAASQAESTRPLAWPGSGGAVVEDEVARRVEGELGQARRRERVRSAAMPRQRRLGARRRRSGPGRSRRGRGSPRGRWRGPCR